MMHSWQRFFAVYAFLLMQLLTDLSLLAFYLLDLSCLYVFDFFVP